MQAGWILFATHSGDSKRIKRTVFNAHPAAVAEVIIYLGTPHMSTGDCLEFTNPYAGLTNDFMPCDTGVVIHHCLADIRRRRVRNYDLYRACIDAGPAECAAGCTEVQVRLAGKIVLGRVDKNNGLFAGCGARVWAFTAVFVEF